MALVSAEQFTKRYPEFHSAYCGSSRDLVLAVLTEAHLLVDEEIFDDLASAAIMAKAAELLSNSQCGMDSGLSGNGKKETNPYTRYFEELSSKAAIGCRVI